MKLILVWVDNTGIKFTGKYRDRYYYHPETIAVPESKACVWGDDTPKLFEGLKAHIEREKSNHVWMGFFRLPNTGDVLSVARIKALEAIA